ncbi:MAG: hypothetical protein AAB367_04555 [Patescibacteria group bacterium]
MTFEKIDTLVLAGATRVSHKFQRLTGRTNFFLAKLGFALGTLSLIIGLGNYWHQFLAFPTSFLILILFLPLTVLWFWMAKKCDSAEDSAFSSTARTKHPLFDNQRMRTLTLVFALVDLAFMPTLIQISPTPILECLHQDYGIALAIFHYFASVDPLPPGQNKVGAWLEAWRSSFAKPTHSSG